MTLWTTVLVKVGVGVPLATVVMVALGVGTAASSSCQKPASTENSPPVTGPLGGPASGWPTVPLTV